MARDEKIHTGVRWLDCLQPHDYPAAESYLSLVADATLVSTLSGRFRAAQLDHFKAKDILRASGLPLLDRSNPHVASDLAKIGAGKALSPVMLVRGELTEGVRLQIADGYHRVCACFHTDENIDIPCLLVAP